jgi:biotin synthase
MRSVEKRLRQVLEAAQGRPVTQDEALFLLHETESPQQLLQLFGAAQKVKRAEAGAAFKVVSTLSSIRKCRITPPCRYCARAGGSLTYNSALELDVLVDIAGAIEARGGKTLHLFGGSDLSSDGDEIVEVAAAIAQHTQLDLCISVGPTYSLNNLRRLKELGVQELGCALETIDDSLFRDAKPGDSLAERKALIEQLKQVGLKLYTTLMVGWGTYEQYVKALQYLGEQEHLSCLAVARFHPVPKTPWENKEPASPLETAKVVAVARLFLRAPDIRYASSDLVFLPTALLCGANRAQVGFLITGTDSVN